MAGPSPLLTLVMTAIISTVASSVAAQAPPPEGLTLDEALSRAATANPSLAALRLRRAVDLAAVAVARERPNPEGRVELDRDDPYRAFSVGLPIETASKRARRIEVGQATVLTGEADVDRFALDIRARVRQAYYGLTAAEQRMMIADELRGLADRARTAARQRFESGAAPRLELLQSELALAQADNETAGARAAVVAARANLNTLLGLQPDAATLTLTGLDAGSVPSADSATSRALAASADVVLLDRQIAEGVARANLARALRYPDPVVEGGATQGFAADKAFDYGWRAGVTVALPIFTRHTAAVQIEEATVARLRAEREAAIAQIRGAVLGAVVRAEAQREQFLRYRDEILLQALEVERMAEDSYRLGQSGLVALLQALQAGRDVRLRSLQTGFDYQIALADLERAIGAPLP